MKVFSLLVFLVFFFLLSEGAPQTVAKIKKGGNVIVNFNIPGLKQLLALMKSMDKKISEVMKAIGSTGISCLKAAKNCNEVLKCGGRNSGIYKVNPDGKGAFQVYCDQTTNGGGWTVFQKRKDGSVDFYRGWNDYKSGFGDLRGEFWLGLDKIYRLTHQTRNRLRVELEDTQGKSVYAEYNYFAVTSERSKYRLSLGTYSGTAGDSLSYHRGKAFTTKDRDNDISAGVNCAVKYKSAWWFGSCHYSQLNGIYYHGKHPHGAGGVNWHHWRGDNYSAKRSEMKIRPT